MPTQDTVSDEEIEMLRSMKLLILLGNIETKRKRRCLQTWSKFSKTRNDLLTINQVNMYKILQRAMAKYELS